MVRFGKLRCSFCGRGADIVRRLMGGPKVHICDACVAACNQIMTATPEDFSDWKAMSDEQLLSGLKVSEATVEATRGVLQLQIDELRRRKVSWDKIGTALGMSRQAAWERFS